MGIKWRRVPKDKGASGGRQQTGVSEPTMALPNFIVFGAPRSGTTALYHYLNQHPEIYLSPVKEPEFFAFEGMNLNFQGPGDGERINKVSTTDLKSYHALFDGVTSEKAIGEMSQIYLYYARAAERIRYYIPEVKLVAILRHPADRAYSNFLLKVRQGYEPVKSFAQALKQEDLRVRANWSPFWYYLRRGFYYAQLRPYFDAFDREQIKVYLYEDYCADVLSMMQDLFGFLGVDDGFVPDTSTRHNASMIPRSRVLDDLIGKPFLIRKVVRRAVPAGLRAWTHHSLRKRNLVRPQIPPPLRQRLTEQYREDILKLQLLIQRDLTAWLG